MTKKEKDYVRNPILFTRDATLDLVIWLYFHNPFKPQYFSPLVFLSMYRCRCIGESLI